MDPSLVANLMEAAYQQALKGYHEGGLPIGSVLADDRFLFVYGRISAERNGKRLDSPHCVVFEFEAGKIVAGRTVPVDLYAFDAFWS